MHFFLDLQTLEDEGSMFLWNARSVTQTPEEWESSPHHCDNLKFLYDVISAMSQPVTNSTVNKYSPQVYEYGGVLVLQVFAQ